MKTDIPHIFDRELYLSRQAKASPDDLRSLHDSIGVELRERLSLITRNFENGILIGSELFASTLRDSRKIASLVTRHPQVNEDLNLNGEIYDSIFSVLDLQTINDVPGYLAQIARALKPDGLLMLAFFAGDTLHELRECWLEAEVEVTSGATPRVAPMIGIRELGGLIQRAGLALPVADLDRTTIRHDNAFRLMQDVKSLGFSNPLIGRSQNLVSRRMMSAVAERYQVRFSDPDGRIRATVEIAWVNAWKPHPSQPQPLKPGTAKARLADALKVSEIKL